MARRYFLRQIRPDLPGNVVDSDVPLNQPSLTADIAMKILGMAGLMATSQDRVVHFSLWERHDDGTEERLYPVTH